MSGGCAPDHCRGPARHRRTVASSCRRSRRRGFSTGNECVASATFLIAARRQAAPECEPLAAGFWEVIGSVIMAEELKGTVLGIGAPNRTKDSRKVQCAIILEERIGLVRVFCDYENGMSRISLWDVCKFDVAASPKDNRFESWKLKHVEVLDKVKESQTKRDIINACVRQTDDDPVDLFNREKRSIGIVKPQQSGIGYGMEVRDFEESPDWVTTQSETPQKPILKWKSLQGKEHNQQICSHEVYEFLRKNPSRHGGLWDNLQITNIDYDKWLLIGTTNSHRSTWVVVHVHRLKKTTQQLIDSSLLIRDGKPNGWPYSQRADVDVKRAESMGQRLLFTI